MEAHRKACAEIDAQYEKTLVEWDKGNDGLRDAQHVWAVAKERYKIAWDAFFIQYAREFGVLWEFYSKALPRGINGYPMFASHHVMHKDDWERARKAIIREQSRMDELEV